MREAEELYAPHAEYFFHKLLYTPSYYQQIPGCLEYPGMVQALQHNPRGGINLRELKAKDFFDRGFVIVGSPKTVREQLMDGVKRLRIGHLLALLHFGSMPTELCKTQHRPVRARGAAASRGPVGRRVRRPLVARAPARQAPPPPPWPQPRERRRPTMATPEVRRLRLWQEPESRPRSRSPAAGRRSSICTGPGALPPTGRSSPASPAANTVYAPRYPGTSRGDPEAVHALDSWLDLIVYYGELLDRLELGAPAFVGHSFGGLVAAEIAAAASRSVGRLVLIDPVGLWRDDLPVKNWMVLSDSERRPSLFADPAGEAAQQFFAVPSDPAARVDVLAQFIWAQACTGKFVWPMPDRGLKNRIAPHRGADPDRLGQGGPHHRACLRAGVRHTDKRREGRTDRASRTPAAPRAARCGDEGRAPVPGGLMEEIGPA